MKKTFKICEAAEHELFHKGLCKSAYLLFGAHPRENGYFFRVWAPGAAEVSVVGDFNGWTHGLNPLGRADGGCCWEGFVGGLCEFDLYKFSIKTRDGRVIFKADPFAFHDETPPGTASKLYHPPCYEWKDNSWLRARQNSNIFSAPMNVYEVHLGSWRKNKDGSVPGYRDMAKALVPYVKKMGYTHIELLPLTEYPYEGSWGYQVTGFYCPTSRFGRPEDLMYFVDYAHRHGVGVIIDWVPAHFPKDEHGLFEFDGAPLYEYSDPLKCEHDGWGTRVFDYGRPEVRSFLISNALYWIECFHFDGLRVDAVASMLYLDYGRQGGQWRPNLYGGRENLEAVEFLRLLNSAILSRYPEVLMIAEESTAWPLVTFPPDVGGLGFNFKWNMGWMNDVLAYFETDPYFRKFHHGKLTFPLMYAFSENFVLPISHDEVVHGKRSLIDKLPGDYADKFAGVRLFLTYMLCHPGKKLIFMGCEFGQFSEWDFQKQLDWMLLEYESHRRLSDFFEDANHLYLQHSELWECDDSWGGFSWIAADDSSQSVLIFRRADKSGKELIVALNLTPVPRPGYRFGVPESGAYEELFNSDSEKYGGSGAVNPGRLVPQSGEMHGLPQHLSITLPPLGGIVLRPVEKNPTYINL